MKTFAILVTMLFLTGCQLFTKTEYVDVIVKEYVVIDDFELRDCPITPPPNKEAYQAADVEGRVDMWVEQYYDTLQSSYMRNLQLKHVREQMQLYR